MNKKQPYLKTQSLDPENQETPINFIDNWLTPEHLVFIRNHFEYPILNESMFFLTINGEVENKITLSYDDIKKMPSKELVMVMECSGNQRKNFEPKVFGEQWENGAISQGRWKGVSLYKILSLALIKNDVNEIVFTAHDQGKRTDMEKIVPYARSLPTQKALHPDTLIAYEYNSKPLVFKQGYPLRLIVPGWYGMASVKWLKSITAIKNHFLGPFQDIDYNYYPYKNSDIGKFPVTYINVSSIIQKPLNYEVLDVGINVIKGIAWTGLGIIEKVEISTDGGQMWEDADLVQNPLELYSLTFFEYKWVSKEKKEYTILSKAYDTFGRVQPLQPFWNEKGYGYNAIHQIKVKVE